MTNSNQLLANEISRIRAIVRYDQGHGAYIFTMKLLFVMKSGKLLNKQIGLLTYYAIKIMAIYSRIQ